jgi:hypothetical protein
VRLAVQAAGTAVLGTVALVIHEKANIDDALKLPIVEDAPSRRSL